MSDPLSMVYDALYDLVMRHPDAADVFKPGNRIRYDRDLDRDPVKDKIQDADLPELILLATGGTIAMHNTSNTSMMTRRYSWLLTTGDMRVHYRLLPIEWLLFEALHNWNVVLTALEWPEGSGRNFVKRCDVLDVTEGLSDPERNRGIRGWSTIWACDVEMWFKTSDVVQELTSLSSGE